MTTATQTPAQVKELAVSTLLKECSVFFAFSNEQFSENKTPLAEGDKYISIGAGGYMPKSKYPAFSQGLENINKEYKKAVKANKEALRKEIVFELHNHECFYTCDISDVVAIFKGVATPKAIYKIYTEEQAKQ